MAFESRCFNTGFFAAKEDYSTTGQFRIVVQSTSANSTAEVASVAGSAAKGILQNKPKVGEPCDIMEVGYSKVVVGTGGLTSGQQYMAAADGSAIPYVVSAGNVPLGRAAEAASAGELGTVSIGLPQ